MIPLLFPSGGDIVIGGQEWERMSRPGQRGRTKWIYQDTAGPGKLQRGLFAIRGGHLYPLYLLSISSNHKNLTVLLRTAPTSQALFRVNWNKQTRAGRLVVNEGESSGSFSGMCEDAAVEHVSHQTQFAECLII